MKKIRDDIFVSPRKKLKKADMAKLKNEQDLMYCPCCNHLIQYKLRTEKNARACPHCGNIFVPAFSPRGKRVSFLEWDSPTEWEEV